MFVPSCTAMPHFPSHIPGLAVFSYLSGMKTKSNHLPLRAVAAVCLLAAFAGSCATQGGTAKTKYVESPVYDTLTINLPDLEDEFCKIRIYGNNAELTGSDYVRYGKVKFYVGSIPGGVHRILIRAGNLVADEKFVKR